MNKYCDCFVVLQILLCPGPLYVFVYDIYIGLQKESNVAYPGLSPSQCVSHNNNNNNNNGIERDVYILYTWCCSINNNRTPLHVEPVIQLVRSFMMIMVRVYFLVVSLNPVDETASITYTQHNEANEPLSSSKKLQEILVHRIISYFLIHFIHLYSRAHRIKFFKEMLKIIFLSFFNLFSFG